MPSFSLTGKVPVVAIVEHTRTIRGRKDPISGASILENINLGWFLHLQFEGGTYAVRCDEGLRPENLKEGDVLNARFWKD